MRISVCLVMYTTGTEEFAGLGSQQPRRFEAGLRYPVIILWIDK